MNLLLTQNKPKFNFKKELNMALSKNKSTKLGWNAKFKEYLQDIEMCIGERIPKIQLVRLKYALEHNTYRKISSEENRQHRAKYRVKKKQMIENWELNTGQKWKRYKEPVYNKHGEMVRRIGDLYDFHHIIPVSYKGDNEWWNGICAKNPTEHQQCIHRPSGVSNRIFT